MRRSFHNIVEMRFLRRFPLLGMVILIIILGLIIGYVWIQFAFPKVISTFNLTESEWSILENITSLGTFAFALGAGLILIIELSEMTDSRNLSIYQDIYEKFMADDAIQARKYIYMKIPTSDDKQVMIDAVLDDEEVKFKVKQVLNLLDYFGFLIDQDWVTTEKMIDWVSPIVVKIWTGSNRLWYTSVHNDLKNLITTPQQLNWRKCAGFGVIRIILNAEEK